MMDPARPAPASARRQGTMQPPALANPSPDPDLGYGAPSHEAVGPFATNADPAIRRDRPTLLRDWWLIPLVSMGMLVWAALVIAGSSWWWQ